MRDAVRLLLHGAAIACFQTLPSDETSSGDAKGQPGQALCATKNCLPSLVSYRPLAYAARLPGRVVADGTRRCYCYRCRGRHRDAADRLRETLGYSGSRDAAVRPGIRGRRVPRACGLRGACVRGDAEAGLSGGLGRRVARDGGSSSSSCCGSVSNFCIYAYVPDQPRHSSSQPRPDTTPHPSPGRPRPPLIPAQVGPDPYPGPVPRLDTPRFP